MENLDKDLQKRVWQRVQSRETAELPQPQTDNIKSLILTAQENSTAYGQLQKQMGPKNREILTRLRRETRSSIACMQGICRLRGEQAKAPQLMPPRDPARRALEKCYHRERKLCGEWEQRITDPEHGMVFRRLAEQGRARCAVIMELLGEMA